MPRVEKFNRQQALNKALDLFWSKGYEATSLNDLTETLGIGKGSFYNTFGSKRNLFDTCISNYSSGGFQSLDLLLQDKSDPIGTIKRFLEFHTDQMLEDSSSRGCFIANSTAELAHDEGVKTFIQEHNGIMKSKFVELLKHSTLTNQAEAIADALLIHVTGISVMSKFIKDKARFTASNAQFMKTLQNA